MQSKAKTVQEYLAELPDDRRKALQSVRKVIKQNLGKGYVEGMQYGMIGYFIPHEIYPAGYHCDPKQPLPFCGVASQKNHMAIYLMCVYSSEKHLKWFREAWAKTGKKLDMGKSCIRFKQLEALSLEVIGEAVRRVPVADFIELYERQVKPKSAKKPAKPKVPLKKQALKKKVAPKKAATKKPAKKKVAKKGTAKKAVASKQKAGKKKVAKKPVGAKKTTNKKTAKRKTARR